MSAFGSGLADQTASATGPPYPTSLGGVQVHLRNQAGTTYLAPLLFVSPTQINFALEPVASIWPEFIDNIERSGKFTSVSIEKDGVPYEESALALLTGALAPGLFAIGPDRLAAATAIRVNPDGTQTPLPTVSCSGDRCEPVAIDTSRGTVYVSVYGTGFSVLIVGTLLNQRDVITGCSTGDVVYQGPQGQIPGLDQVNIRISPNVTGLQQIGCRFDAPNQTPSTFFTPMSVSLLFNNR